MGDLGFNSHGGYQLKWVTGMAALADNTKQADRDVSLDTSCILLSHLIALDRHMSRRKCVISVWVLHSLMKETWNWNLCLGS